MVRRLLPCFNLPKGKDVYKRQDPTKVTRSALQNAASVAQMVLTTESLVADKKEPAAPAAPAAPDMGGM